MKKVYVFLAPGFEEVEGLTVVDLLRRAGIEVTMISIEKELLTVGARGIAVMADKWIEDADFTEADLLVLPGGMPGTTNLGACELLTKQLSAFHAKGKKIAAICAAPSIFGELGLLEGRTATCYPGMEDQLLGAKVSTQRVVVDGNITTSRGVGTAISFSLSLIEQLLDADTANKIKSAIVYGH